MSGLPRSAHEICPQGSLLRPRRLAPHRGREGRGRALSTAGNAPAERLLYGPETEKALANFGRGSIPRELIAAYAKVKRAAVEALQETEGRFDATLFRCLVDALDEIASGALDGHFPLPLRQGGAGTSLNMNLNEVAAARACELFRRTERNGSPEARSHRGRQPRPVDATIPFRPP